MALKRSADTLLWRLCLIILPHVGGVCGHCVEVSNVNWYGAVAPVQILMVVAIKDKSVCALVDRVDKGFIATVVVYELAVPKLIVYTIYIYIYIYISGRKGNGLIFPCLQLATLTATYSGIHIDADTTAGQSYRLC